MATCRTLLRVSAGTGRPPGDVLAEVNDRIQPDIPSGMFVTCLLAMIDPSTGSMALANAGHNLPYRAADELIVEIMARGMPLGLMPDMFYEEIEGRLSPGDSLVLTSDGLAEAHAPDGEMYGTERLRHALSRANDGPRERNPRVAHPVRRPGLGTRGRHHDGHFGQGAGVDRLTRTYLSVA